MALEVGIVGPQGSGKTSLFTALTKAGGGEYGKTNVGVAPIADDRLQQLAQVVKARKITPATIRVQDIPGSAAFGELRQVDALLVVVREPDDLALSSRNAYLSADERRRAVALPKALNAARQAIRGGTPVATALQQGKQALVDAGFLKIDYLALVDAATLEPLEQPKDDMRLIAAAVIGTTRLIDNVAV